MKHLTVRINAQYIRAFFVSAVIAAASLTGCTGAPDAHAAYVGTWKSQHTALTITRSGRMNYHRDASETRVEERFVNVPIKQISPKEIVGAVGDARLEITEPPHQAGGSWQMTVNGDVLTKQ